MSLEEQVEHLYLLVTGARKRIRLLEQTVKDLKAPQDDTSGYTSATTEDEDEVINVPPVRVGTKRLRSKREKVNYVESSESSESESSESESEEFESEEIEQPLPPRVHVPEYEKGTIFTRDNENYAVYLGGDEHGISYGWLYSKENLPNNNLKSLIGPDDYVVSDHDYETEEIHIRYSVVNQEYILNKIRYDLIYYVDTQKIGAVRSDSDNYNNLRYMEREFGCQIHFGLPSKNSKNSTKLITDLCEEEFEETDITRPYHGKCGACSMSPKWITKKITLGDSVYNVGDTCAKRATILNTLIEEDHKVVYLFRFMETERALKRLKVDAASAARAYFG